MYKSASVKRGDENNIVFVLDFVLNSSNELPVRVVHQNQNAGANSASADEKFWSFFEKVILDEENEVPQVRILSILLVLGNFDFDGCLFVKKEL
eukprot:TRINITY_DN4025_c0_g1_i1.p2 TRINITY_DN4025_c0_g1~~TRINITY_DN4025_c0_g1_i1.p2  ORF type:complete len:94 (+),score=9.56 TRINITY_DN4025_c0_g1_i1:90-371(+)